MENQTTEPSPSPSATCCALDVAEWIGTFRLTFQHHADRGELDGMQTTEWLFDAMWDGHGGAHNLRWHQLLGAPKEDGRKILYQESPYENLHDWVKSLHNIKEHAPSPAGASVETGGEG